VPYYFEFNMYLFFTFFFELKIRVLLRFEVLFFTLRKSRKIYFPRRKCDLAIRVVLARNVFFNGSPFLKAGCIVNYRAS
jgi:hypothetical protein